MFYFSTYCVVITKTISTPIAPTITDIGNQCSFIVSALGKDILPSAFNNPLNNPLPLPSVNVFSGFVWYIWNTV